MQRTRAAVDAGITLYELPSKAIERLRKGLSYPNPEYLRFRKRGIDVDDIPSDVTRSLSALIEWPDGPVQAPRGATFEVEQALIGSNLKAQYEDKRSYGAPIEVTPDFTPRDYQSQGVDVFQKRLQGMIVIPCGGGKTMVGIAAIARMRRSTLVLVPSLDLLDQWAVDVRAMLGIEPGIVGGGKKKPSDVTIATVQTIAAGKHGLDLSQFGVCILDECHLVAAPTVYKTLSQIPARWRLGLTATPDREDGQSKLVGWSFGPRLLERTVPQLVKYGWLVLPSVHTEHTRFRYEWERGGDAHELTRALVDDVSRNTRVASRIATEVQNGNSVLALSNDKGHCEKLRELVEAYGVEAVVLTSDVGKKKRRDTLNAMRSGELRLIIATSLADQGLNIPRLNRLILALPEGAKGRCGQRAGRLMRPKDEARIYEFIDDGVPPLLRRWAKRRSVYKKLGLEIVAT